MSRARARSLVSLVVASLALTVAACGDDDDAAPTTSTAAPAASATNAAAKRDAGSRTLGIVPVQSAGEALNVEIKQIEQYAPKLGWKVVVLDGAGDPTKMNQAVQALVTQRVDAIFTLSIGGEEIATGLAQAKKAGIPVIAVGQDPSPGQEKNFAAVFADGTINMGKFAGSYIADNLGDTTIVGERVTQNFGGDGFIQGIIPALKAKGKAFKDLRDTNLADLINSMTKTAEAIVRNNPGPLTFVDFSDFGSPLFLPVFERAKRDDITIVTRYANPSTIKLLRQGKKILIVGTRFYQHAFDASSALLALWADKKPLPTTPQISEPDVGVYDNDDIPEGSDELFPFQPAMEKQLATWGETYELR